MRTAIGEEGTAEIIVGSGGRQDNAHGLEVVFTAAFVIFHLHEEMDTAGIAVATGSNSTFYISP
jgi:hypothetical protein